MRVRTPEAAFSATLRGSLLRVVAAVYIIRYCDGESPTGSVSE